jgi:PKD domain
VKASRVAVLVFLSVFLSLSSSLVQDGHSQYSTQISQVYVDPLKSPTLAFNASGPPEYFNVSVKLNLDAGILMNVFDVVLDYGTNNAGGYSVSPVGLDLANNVFAGFPAVPVVECINATAFNGVSCEPSDGIGSIHVVEGVQSTSVPGGFTNGLLFRVRFRVTSNGSSAFTFASVQLIDPGPTAPYNQHFIPVVATGGVWGNRGIVPFFNVLSSDGYPALLPGTSLIFDASGSFNANNTSIKIVKYSWIFGDNGTFRVNATMVPTYHTYLSPGQYLVRLTVMDAVGNTGSWNNNIVVSPPLGTLIIIAVDTHGNSLRGLVSVKASNSTWSFANVTDFNNQAVFHNLAPGNYTVVLSGPTVMNTSRSEKVFPGLSFQDVVYMTLLPAPPNYQSLVYIGVLATTLAAVIVVLIRKKLSDSNAKSSGRRSSSISRSRR